MSREHIQALTVEVITSAAQYGGTDFHPEMVAVRLVRKLGIPSLHKRAAVRGVTAVLYEQFNAGVRNQDLVSGAVADWLMERGLGE